MANRLSSGMLPFEYLPLSTPDARGLQIVVPAPDAMYKLAHMQSEEGSQNNPHSRQQHKTASQCNVGFSE